MAEIRVNMQNVLDYEVTFCSSDSKYYLRMSRVEWERMGRPDYIETDFRPIRFTHAD